MRTASLLVLLFCLSDADVSAADAPPPHGFVLLETSAHEMSLWDAGDIRRDGDTIEAGILRISVGPGTPLFIYGSIQGTRLSCEWETIDRFLPAMRYDSSGRASDVPSALAARPLSFVQPTFYGPYGWFAHIVDTACDPNFQVPAAALPSVAAAMKLARRTLNPLPPPSNTVNTITVQRIAPKAAPQPLPGYASLGPYRFGVTITEPSSGNAAFLDWAGLRRTGDQATALVLEVLGDDTPAATQWPVATIALRSVQFDCTARTIGYSGYAEFDKTISLTSQDKNAWPPRSAKGWRVGTALLEAACSGSEPAQTFASLEDAVAFQRQLHPLRAANAVAPASAP